jgi:HlyD family secretion protein
MSAWRAGRLFDPADEPVVGSTDRAIRHPLWSPWGWPLPVGIGAVVVMALVVAVLALRLIAGGGVRTFRVPREQATFASVERGVFHDLIPLHATVVPRDTVYVDTIDGGRVDRVLVEPGDMVQEGQPIVELTNTNLALQVIQEESQLNQAISQLQQNEIALEQQQLSNARALAEIDYNLVRLGRSAERRESLAAQNSISLEQRDLVADELAHFRRLRPIQAESSQRQTELYDHLLPDIHLQLKILRGNLAVVHDKLDSLIVRAPVAGKVTAIDLKIGETPTAGKRLAEIAPQTGMKLAADVDEFYLPRVRVGQTATINIEGSPANVTVQRVYPQVHDGQFRIDLAFSSDSPVTLVEGATELGSLQLGGDTSALILPTGPFLERTGGDWVFVVTQDGRSAERRRIKLGRRNSEQLEITGSLEAGERVMTSDYTGFDQVDRLILTR